METSRLRSKKELFILLALGVGLIVGIVLVGRQQFFQPKASTSYVEIRGADNQPLPQTNNVPVSNSSNLKVELKPPQTP